MSSGIRKVGVIGIGLMGSGIAQVAATQGFDTVVVDVSSDIVERGMRRIQDSLERMVESHRKSSGERGIDAARRDQILSLIHPSLERERLLDRDILIEAVVESEAAKKEVIAALSGMGYQGIFVSNTSSISITRLASSYSLPDKFMGMHFMNPVPVQPGCELIRGFLTSEQSWQAVVAFCRELGKEAILAEDKAGFGINRMFIPFLAEAVKVVEEGIMSCEDADKTTLCLGHKMGPITTLDYVGLDTTLAIAEVLEKELGPCYRAPVLLKRLVEAGSTGIKNGRGFYIWDSGKKVKVNPAVERYRKK